MDFCTFMLSLTIVGAVEAQPNIMFVQYIDDETRHVEELYVYTEDYIGCLEQPAPLPEFGGTDS